VKEEVFWRNYFYRVSLIKQSAQLTALAAQQQASVKEEKNNSTEDNSPLTGKLQEKDLTLQTITVKILLT
jgi:hypothetical protein